jgi:hypothetical protein
MEAVSTSETRRCIPEGCHLQTHRREKILLTGLKITMNRKSRVVPDRQTTERNAQAKSRIEGQSMLSVKVLMRKTASRGLYLMWSEIKFNLNLRVFIFKTT